MYSYDFRVTSYPFRLYSGKNALDKLPDEVERNHARRAFIVCGRTVSRKTPLISNLRQLLGEQLAGVFDEIDKDTSRSSVTRAAEAAREVRADLVIGVGAGSVIQGARIVTILLAEKHPVEQLVTQYPEHGPAISPKLAAGAGWTTGLACVINCECELSRVAPGAVLITKMAGPALSQILPRVSGVVAELGGSTSHLASLARERGIPMVLGVAHATTRIPEGSMVSVDGVSGVVRWMPSELQAPQPVRMI